MGLISSVWRQSWDRSEVGNPLLTQPDRGLGRKPMLSRAVRWEASPKLSIILVMGKPDVFRWLLDVKDLWPELDVNGKSTTSTAEWGSSKDVEQILNLLSSAERLQVLRFYFIRDAKLSLGSFLLKHHAITFACHVPWADSVISKDKNHKPCYKPSDPQGKTVEFNVSHHGTLVAMVCCTDYNTKMGVDIVQMNFERDFAAVQSNNGGFPTWVKTYEAVFSDREVAEIADYIPSTDLDVRSKIRAQLRHFYAHWCLKEAYVKMTGEALSAPWLKDLEFRNVSVPMPVNQVQSEKSLWGQLTSNVEIFFHGTRVTDVKMELQAYEENYMIATAIADSSIILSPFQPSNIGTWIDLRDHHSG